MHFSVPCSTTHSEQRMSNPHENKPSTTRRTFVSQLAALALAPEAIEQFAGGLKFIKPVSVANPLEGYPNRGWERVYRDLYRSDSRFSFLCAPNDTHNCLLWAHVKNGVVTRISPTYGYGKATDQQGNRATGRWDPRCCQKGLALVRRFYGDRRIRKPMARAGFRSWIQAGCPRDSKTGAVDHKYLNRGADSWIEITWDEAFQLSAHALHEIAKSYTGDEGKQRLLAQGFDPLMVDATKGVGMQTLKFRGGMPALGMTRIFAQYRLANAMALVDDKLRGKGAEGSVGARGWDNYSWHTDLPPGHPMVTGQQTVDFDLCCVEHAGLVIAWGMNWITTKMPDSHWLTEARLKGTKVVVIATEYSATMNKADAGVVVRPGTTPALALGFAQVILKERLFDAAHVKATTDLPFLIRTDTGTILRANEVFKNHVNATLTNNITVAAKGDKLPPPYQQSGPIVSAERREEWGDFVVWDETKRAPVVVTRDQCGNAFADTGINPALEGSYEVTLADGSRVRCRTVLDATRELLDGSYTPADVEKITWAPIAFIETTAREIAANAGKTLFALGMGPNQFFNSDLKDRAVFLVAALTQNVGKIGGNVGSYAGNYRASLYNGITQWTAEDPFDPELDPSKQVRTKMRWKAESVHYFNHGDTILRAGDAVLTGSTHMPTPTKSIVVSNSNSLIGNAKGHYDTVVNVLKRVEFVAVSDWWWTASCEYADIVFPVDSWAELKYPDMTISVTNPFLYTFPATPLPRIHDTRSDLEVAAGISKALGVLTNDDRHEAFWKFVNREDCARPYIQRVLNISNATRGYQIEDLEAKAKQGIPSIVMTRTYPKVGGWEQGTEGKPWYTRSGRMEFYRDEVEFRDAGENLVLHREPIDSTFFEPNVIVAKQHELLRPKLPRDYKFDEHDEAADLRQARNVTRTVDELLATAHPLIKDGYDLIFHTPKYRHGAHTTPVDTDIIAVWFGPFGDMLRRDKRVPFVSEMYVDISPIDAKKLKIEDGDYVWIDADPHDRPFRGWQKNPEWYKVARLLARARYYPGTPTGITRMWHNTYGATHGSVRGAEVNPTGLAKNPDTKYQALFRTGSQQSCTRGWLKPTWMTDTLNVKTLFGQEMAKGFVPDVHCPTGAPREAIVRITRAEPGGIDGAPLWLPAQLGLRPTYENPTLRKYLDGAFFDRNA